MFLNVKSPLSRKFIKIVLRSNLHFKLGEKFPGNYILRRFD